MREEEFFEWLIRCNDCGVRTAQSRKSNCCTICRYEGDLDELFLKDKCAALLKRLEYSKNDEAYNRPAKHSIPINGSIYNGTATYRNAAKLYIKFLLGEKNPSPQKDKAKAIPHKNTAKNDWPIWSQPNEDDGYELTQITTRYVRFLSPEIIKAVVDENEKLRDKISQILDNKGIDSTLYMWEKTSCCFPGVRRYAGSSEIAAYRKRSTMNKIEDALALDDNDFPKQIWSYIFRGAQFSKFGPADYSLAHLIDHKKDKNRMAEEFIFNDGHKYEKPLYGLYTCASNSVYVPNNLMKPTDFNGSIRNLLFQKAFSLYGDYCQLVPSYITLKKPENEKWNVDNFEWSEPVGTLDNINEFLTFRKRKLGEILGEDFF